MGNVVVDIPLWNWERLHLTLLKASLLSLLLLAYSPIVFIYLRKVRRVCSITKKSHRRARKIDRGETEIDHMERSGVIKGCCRRMVEWVVVVALTGWSSTPWIVEAAVAIVWVGALVVVVVAAAAEAAVTLVWVGDCRASRYCVIRRIATAGRDKGVQSGGGRPGTCLVLSHTSRYPYSLNEQWLLGWRRGAAVWTRRRVSDASRVQLESSHHPGSLYKPQRSDHQNVSKYFSSFLFYFCSVNCQCCSKMYYIWS